MDNERRMSFHEELMLMMGDWAPAFVEQHFGEHPMLTTPDGVDELERGLTAYAEGLPKGNPRTRVEAMAALVIAELRKRIGQDPTERTPGRQ
jgi:hypothetical protein